MTSLTSAPLMYAPRGPGAPRVFLIVFYSLSKPGSLILSMVTFSNLPLRKKVVTQIGMLLYISLTMLCRYLPNKTVYKLTVLAHSFYASIDLEI